MKPLTTALTACLLASGAMAEAQDRFGYRRNYTALRQNVPYRAPSYNDYYRRYNNQSPRYEARRSQFPASDYRHTGGLSNRANWAPIYQFYNPGNGDQLLTANVQNENYSAMHAYLPDGVFLVSPTGGPGMVPLYRFWEPYDMHSFSTSQRGMEDARLEGILGYIETRQTGGTVPLYSWYDPYMDRYLVTTNPNSDLQQNFEYLGVLGYVMPGR